MKLIGTAALLLASSVALHAASAVADMEDKELSQVEKEVVSLAEAMPADKYDFAPTEGAFNGVRTFGQQMGHIAAVLNVVSAGLLGEKAPDTGKSENGPDSLKGKDAIVTYLKQAFAHAHQAVATLTDQNYTQKVNMAWGEQARGYLAGVYAWHTFDHYGQAVIYARMNNVVPPASRH